MSDKNMKDDLGPLDNIEQDEEISQAKQLIDAGEQAKITLEDRRKKKSSVKRKLRNFFGILFYITLGLGVVGGYEIYKRFTEAKTVAYHYKRQCALPVDSGLDIRGERRYLNKAREFLGMKLVDANKASEDTTLRSTNKETTVVGITGKEWWSVYNPAAEPRVMTLKKADTYIFTQGNKTHVIDYDDFCR